MRLRPSVLSLHEVGYCVWHDTFGRYALTCPPLSRGVISNNWSITLTNKLDSSLPSDLIYWNFCMCIFLDFFNNMETFQQTSGISEKLVVFVPDIWLTWYFDPRPVFSSWNWMLLTLVDVCRWRLAIGQVLVISFLGNRAPIVHTFFRNDSHPNETTTFCIDLMCFNGHQVFFKTNERLS